MDGNNFDNNYQDNTANIPYQASVEEATPNKANGLQIAGLVCGILAICLSCCYGVPGILLGIAGLICGIKGNKKGKTGVGTAGIVCSVIGLVLGVIMLIYYVVILGTMFSILGTMDADALVELYNY